MGRCCGVRMGVGTEGGGGPDEAMGGGFGVADCWDEVLVGWDVVRVRC